ncbi:MAG: hypothetical protein ACKVJ2_12000 [Pseudomonadales bacterium]
MPQAFWRNFLGNPHIWYKQVIIGLLIFNPILHALVCSFETQKSRIYCDFFCVYQMPL